ncbi:pollen-specific leucine-rich repeat extensin-like protein 2 [Phragmites australis]|uniref:pollen-specific leucine-rich repeat extensin-like protein 2 n=1 Tax=Phragmites australis TaxID=29695 RepID=UPI002D779CF2|nr:pollen-specific leucine-rich repeat extensin-like protein 2 [Phragmites australis]
MPLRAELVAMAATVDPRAKAPAAPPHHLEPWARQPPAAHRMPVVLPAAASQAGGGCFGRDRRGPSSHRRAGASQVVGEDPYDGGIEELRAKLMGHLRDAADRLHVPRPSPSLPPPPPPKTASPPPEADSEPEPELRAPPPPAPLPPPPLPQQQPQADATTRPWNLRERTQRRPAAAARSWAASVPSSSSRRRRKRAPFSVSLTTEEIEEDIYALTGARPRRRPRKRPRVVQRQLDSLFPGLWLTEFTADAYRVPDE